MKRMFTRRPESAVNSARGSKLRVPCNINQTAPPPPCSTSTRCQTRQEEKNTPKPTVSAGLVYPRDTRKPPSSLNLTQGPRRQIDPPGFVCSRFTKVTSVVTPCVGCKLAMPHELSRVIWKSSFFALQGQR